MHMHKHHHHDGQPAVDSSMLDHKQAICSVTGDVVNKHETEALGHNREYKGQTYYFCCATCVQLFDEDPEQYATHQTVTAKLVLVEKEKLVDNIWAFRFRPSEPMTWKAGQFIRIELSHDQPDDEGTKRWFTISSAPYEGIVQITTRVTSTTFKQALAALPIGGEVRLLEAPHGSFVWQDSNRPLVFVAGGVGITPFYSILKQRVHEGQSLDVTLVYAGRSEALPFKEELEAWQKLDASLKAHYLIGTPLTPQSLLELALHLKESLVYLSGPEPMIEGLSDGLKATGLPDQQIKRDAFPNYGQLNY